MDRAGPPTVLLPSLESLTGSLDFPSQILSSMKRTLAVLGGSEGGGDAGGADRAVAVEYGPSAASAGAEPGPLMVSRGISSEQAMINRTLVQSTVLNSVLALVNYRGGVALRERVEASAGTIAELEDSLAETSMVVEELNTTVEDLADQLAAAEAAQEEEARRLAALESSLYAQSETAADATLKKDMAIDAVAVVSGLWAVSSPVLSLPLELLSALLPLSARTSAWLTAAIRVILVGAWVGTVRHYAGEAGLYHATPTTSTYLVLFLRTVATHVRALLRKLVSAVRARIAAATVSTSVSTSV